MNESLHEYDEILIKNGVYVNEPENVYNYMVRYCGHPFDFLELTDKIRKTPDNLYYYSKNLEKRTSKDPDTTYCFIDTGIRSIPNEFHKNGEPIVISCIKSGKGAFRGKITGTIFSLHSIVSKYSDVPEDLLRKRRDKIRELLDSEYVKEPEYVSAKTSNTTVNERIFPDIIRPKALQKKIETNTPAENVAENKKEEISTEHEEIIHRVHIFHAERKIDKEALKSITEDDAVLFLYNSEDVSLPISITSILFEKKIEPRFIPANNQEKLLKIAYFIGTIISKYDISFYGKKDDPLFILMESICDLSEQKDRAHRLIPDEEEKESEEPTKQAKTPEKPREEIKEEINKPDETQEYDSKKKKSQTNTSQAQTKNRIKEAFGKDDPHGKYSKLVLGLMQSARDESDFNLKFIQTMGPAKGIPLASDMKEIYREFKREGAQS